MTVVATIVLTAVVWAVVAANAGVYALGTVSDSTLTIAGSAGSAVLVALIMSSRGLRGSRINAANTARSVALEEIRLQVDGYKETIERQDKRIRDLEADRTSLHTDLWAKSQQILDLIQRLDRLSSELEEAKRDK